MGTEKQGRSTSPSKVYAKRERTADFLLEEESIKSDSESSEVGLELLRRLEDDSCHPKTLSRFRVGGNVVNINGFPSSDFAGLKGCTIDDWVGLAGADAVGVDAGGKEAKEGEARLLMGHVDGVGVGKQAEAVIL